MFANDAEAGRARRVRVRMYWPPCCSSLRPLRHNAGSEDIMNIHRYAAAAVMLSSMLVNGSAGAQERDQTQSTSDRSASLAPATRNVEMTIGTGYEQGFGNIAS